MNAVHQTPPPIQRLDVTADPVVVSLSTAHSAIEILQYFIHTFPGFDLQV